MTSQNPVELEGLKNAHIRDGAAVVQYLVWLDNQVYHETYEPWNIIYSPDEIHYIVALGFLSLY